MDHVYEQRYRQLVERLPVVVYRASVLSGDWHYVSPAIERVLGWTVEEWQSHEAPWGSSLHADDRAEAVAQEELAVESGVLSSEYRLVRRDGRIVWIHDEAVLLEEDGEPQWHGILTDVTERRALEARLRQSQKLEAVGQLAGGIAHDFNNLLVAISGYGELALARAGSDPELSHELEQIRIAADRARDLTQRLLSFSRKEARTEEVVDLNAVLASAHPMLRRLIGADVELVTVLADEPCFAAVDPTELDQALLNLAVNARDAMPHGGRLSISVEHRQRDDGVEQAGLRVADSGEGIPPELLPELFEPFFTTKEAGRGTGLGLAMVKEFVDRCGGTVEVESAPGSGAAFTLVLPRAATPGWAGKPTEAPAASPSGRETILVIEDDDAVREITSRVLARAGYAVIEARYGSEAIELAAGTPIDLVLSDVVMPGLSGPEVVARLQAERPRLPALFMSGYAPESEGPLGGAELVRKPFTVTQLLTTVRSALDLDPPEQHAAVVTA